MNPPHQDGKRALTLLAAIFTLAVGFIAAWLWASEPWQRPLSILGVADGIWLAIAIAGFGAGVVVWPASGPLRWGWRAVGCIAISFFLPTALQVRSSAAVKALLNHDVILDIVSSGSAHPTASKSWQDRLKEFWREEILHFFEVPRSYSSMGVLKHDIPPDAYDHLLETCRWPTRRAFLHEIFDDELRVHLATNHWHRLFPAIIGQDVSLSHRTELLDWLDVKTADQSTPAACRDAAAFWMALIVLTDAEAFAPWAERTLSHMLASEAPPVSTAHFMWMRPSGDVWMRALDLLLAMMPEDTHAALTAPLARDSTLLRRAFRQRVRGMQHHADAIMEEIEALDKENRNTTAAAVWLDLKRVADQLATGDHADDINVWLASMMGSWLLEDSVAVIARFSPYVKSTLSHRSWNTVEENFVLPLPAQSADRLAALAHATLDKLGDPLRGGKIGISMELEHALIIAAFLGVEEGAAIYNRVAVLVSMDTLRKLPPGREVWEPLSWDLVGVKELLEHPEFLKLAGDSAFLDYLERHPSNANARDLLMNHLSRLTNSQDRIARIHAFKILLGLSGWLGDEERLEFRKRFHLFFRQDRPGLEEWVNLLNRNDQHPWWIQARNHRGEGVPWEDDALSAALSWSSQIHHELASLPSNSDDEIGLFRHLCVSGAYFELSEWDTPEFYQIGIDVIAPTSVFSDPVPSPPFAATAWQRARDLHLRRPDLKFPARPIFRPSGDQVRLRKKAIWVDP